MVGVRACCDVSSLQVRDNKTSQGQSTGQQQPQPRHFSFGKFNLAVLLTWSSCLPQALVLDLTREGGCRGAQARGLVSRTPAVSSRARHAARLHLQRCEAQAACYAESHHLESLILALAHSQPQRVYGCAVTGRLPRLLWTFRLRSVLSLLCVGKVAAGTCYSANGSKYLLLCVLVALPLWRQPAYLQDLLSKL